MKEKEITLTFYLEQVCNDILAKCNLIGKSIRDEAMNDIKADIMTPDSQETLSVICRATTEAFANLKIASQRYQVVGRTADNNLLERLVASYDEDAETGEISNIEYETLVWTLLIPNFNTSVTDGLKSWMHKYVVDYVMWRFLQDQHPEKAGEYKKIADDEDYPNVVKCLNMRENFNFRRARFM